MDNFTILHTFKIRELFLTFDVNKLSITKDQIQTIAKGKDKRFFAIMIWKTVFKKVIDDIISKGIQFQFPGSGGKKAYMCLQKISDFLYFRERKKGAFKNFDPVETNCSAYRLEYCIEKPLGVYTVPIHLDKKRTQLIEKLALSKINVGKIVTYTDYYDYCAEVFPQVSRQNIFRILRFGFTSFKLHMSYGGDIALKYDNLYFQTGRVYTNKALMLNYVLKKAKVKSRVMYRKLHYLWDGYLYFSLTHAEYEKIRGQTGVINYGTVYLFKNKDEAFLNAYNKPVLFRVKVDNVKNRFMTILDLRTSSAELVQEFSDWHPSDIEFKNITYKTLLPSSVAIQSLYTTNKKIFLKWLRKNRWETKRL